MNSINGSWDDRLNQLKQQDLQREIEHLQLLKEVEQVNPSLLSLLGRALQKRLLALGRRRRNRKSLEQVPYKQARGKTTL